MISAGLRFRFILTFAGLSLAAQAGAWTVSGHIRDAQGTGIFGVDLDFEDRNTGMIIVTPNDDTDANGFYSTTVPTGDYRIYFNPLPGTPYFADKTDLAIGTNTVVNRTLGTGSFVSGYVFDEFGAGLFNVDLNFYDATTGENLGYGGDNTDAAGFYQVLVDQGLTFDILYRPSPGDPHVALVLPSIAVGTSNVVLPNVVLDPGHFVTGQVRRKGTTTPVAGADIDAVDTATGMKISRLGFDNTDAAGNWQVVLKAGVWDIIVSPPGGSGLAAEIKPNVSITGSTPVGLIELPVGYSVGGTVNGPSGALSGVNVDPIDIARGIEAPTSGDHSGTSGQYAMTLAAKTYDMIYWPPSGQPLAAGVLRNRVVTGNTTLPLVTLTTGFTVSGFVRTTGGLPVWRSDINAVQVSDGFSYPLRSDNSQGDGAYSVRVPGGTYRMIASPPAESGLRPDTVVVALGSNQVIDFFLAPNGTVGVPESVPGGESLALRALSANPGAGPFTLGVTPDVRGGPVSLRVYSVDGRLLRRLHDGVLATGETRFNWDARDDSGQPVPAGMYFVLARSTDRRSAVRLTVTRQGR